MFRGDPTLSITTESPMFSSATVPVVNSYLDDVVVTAILPCGSADFNCDGDVGTDQDIDAFFACLSGNCPPPRARTLPTSTATATWGPTRTLTRSSASSRGKLLGRQFVP